MSPCRYAVAAALLTLLAGCSLDPTPAYVSLQNSIMRSIIRDDQRAVQSVACSPHVKDVSYEDGVVHLHCVVRFTNGTSYSTEATIEARSYQVSGWDFTFDEPGPAHDITTAPLPRPAPTIVAADPASLFYARNLRTVMKALAARFATNQLILNMAVYPGELEAVMGADGQAQLVTVHPSGALTVGPPTRFVGQRRGITVSQLNPGVPQRLAQLIARRAHVPINELDRFVLGSEGDLAIWKIYTSRGQTRFQAHLQGDSLEEISPQRTHRLN